MLSAVLTESMAQPIDPQSFYAHLHSVARSRGMKASGAIKKAGLSQQAGEKWKAGTSPKYETRQRLARAMGVPVALLIREGEEIDVPEPSAPLPANDGAERDERYPSLVEFLLRAPTLEDERHYLERQRFLFGDPGSDVWPELLEAYRKAKRAKVLNHASAANDSHPASAQKPKKGR